MYVVYVAWSFELVELALYWVIDKVQNCRFSPISNIQELRYSPQHAFFFLHCTAANFPLANTIQKAVSRIW
jgi:hypothetical protein